MYEYRNLMMEDVRRVDAGQPMLSPGLRAWIREADSTIRQNNALAGIAAQEEPSWLTRAWNRFISVFGAQPSSD